MSGRTVTIRDVAARADVSESTVSRVLSGTKTRIPISNETQERVRQAAEALGYRPHPSARALSGKRTNLIGVIVREIKDPFFADLIDAISFAAKEEGYDLVLGNARRDPEEALLLRDMMLDMRYCDGILLCGDLRESDQERSFVTRMSRDHRLVSVARGSGPLVEGVPSVDIDNRLGVQLALEYLVRLGHRQIACLDASRIGDLRERLEAYRAFMGAHFGSVPEAYVQRTENSYEGGYAAARRLLSLPTPPTAIFAADDMMAVGVLAAAHDMELDVPGFVSVIGFDDMAFSHCVRPTLTTVRQPIQDMAERSLELLWQMIDQEASPDEVSHIQLAPELVIRKSCGAPR